jgi:hypothetical protein
MPRRRKKPGKRGLYNKRLTPDEQKVQREAAFAAIRRLYAEVVPLWRSCTRGHCRRHKQCSDDAPLPRTQLAVADAEPERLGVVQGPARRSAPRAAGVTRRMAFAPVSGVELRALKTFGHCNFVNCKEILTAQRRMTNLAMRNAGVPLVCSLIRSFATTKPLQMQQMAEAWPDLVATSNA